MTNITRILKVPTILLSTALLATSCAGAVGSAGPAGPQGSAGAPGAQGLPGVSGSNGAAGAAGAVGPQGPAGARGPAGSQGPAGTAGTTGATGDSAYDLYIAEYPLYAAAVSPGPGLGLNASQWIKDLAANTLYPTFTLDYTGQTEFVENFVELTSFRAYKGQSLAQFPLVDLFATLTPDDIGGGTLSDHARSQYLIEFYSNANRTTLIPSNFIYNVASTIYVKATRIGVDSIVVKNEINGSDIVATGNSKDGFALTVPLETVPYSNKFTHYLATANAAVKTDGKIYSNSAATTEFQSFLVMRDGATGTGSNLTSDLLDIDDAARLSFGIWQNSGDAVPPGGYLSFATPGTFTVYLRVYFDAVSFRIVPLAITVTNQEAASIVAGSTTSSLTEAAANDGSLTSPTVTITILNGVLADPLVKADVTAANLPAGMDFTLVRTSNTVATVTITGSATNHANANDVNNLNFTIARAKVTGAIANLVTPNISINFNDPSAPDAAINIAAIGGVTAPVLGATPVASITESNQYTGTVAWSTSGGAHTGAFAGSTVYTATITLTAKSGFTLTGVAADFFTVAGADSDTNLINAGVITAVFPATAAPADTVIDIAAIGGVTAPVLGATPVASITESNQYTGTVAWSTSGGAHTGAFAGSTVYTATITLTAKSGFTLTGVAADFFTVAGADSDTNLINAGVITAVFPATAAPSSDATLVFTGGTQSTLAGVNILAGAGTGADAANAISLTVTIPDANKNNAVLVAAKAEVNSSVVVYYGDPLVSGNFIPLEQSPNNTQDYVDGDIVWILVTAHDQSTQLYYKLAVTVAAAPTASSFASVTANGASGVTTTTELIITLDADIDLAAGDITLTGATKGALVDNNNGTYTLSINTITVADGANVNVALSKSGFAFTPANRTVAVNVAAADTTAPTVVFLPADSATDVAINSTITLTFSEAVRNLDDSALADGDLAALITLKETNASGANVAFTAVINAEKTVITITPNANLTNNQAYYVAIGASVEDAADNALVAVNATFTTVAAAPANSTVPETASYIIDNGTPLDVLVTLNGNTLVSISENSTPIDLDINYEIIGAGNPTITVRFFETYTNSLPEGTTTFIFTFSAGDPDSIVVTVSGA
jgi:hypothetical protein